MRIAAVGLGLALLLPGCVTTKNADTFTESGMLYGSVMTKEACDRKDADTALWLVVDGRGECIRYFHAGLEEGGNELVHVALHGDRMKHDRQGIRPAGYRNRTADIQRRLAYNLLWRTGLPSIALSRPGTYGSSGFHAQRRRPREVAIVRAAFDALRERYGIERFAVSGQSGGGHLVGALLPARQDIACAAATSGVLAVGLRIRTKGWSTDITGYTDFYDPIDHVDEIPDDRERTILIIGDPRDVEVPFKTQRSYFEAVRDAGHDAWLISTKTGRGRKYHGLQDMGWDAIKYCAEGMPSEEIVQRLTHVDGRNEP